MLLVPHSRTGLNWSGASGSYNSEAIEQKVISHRKWMGFLKNLNKIGGAKYYFLVRCVLLVPHSRTGLHWSGVSGSNTWEAIEQKAIFHRKWMAEYPSNIQLQTNFTTVRLRVSRNALYKFSPLLLLHEPNRESRVDWNTFQLNVFFKEIGRASCRERV